RAASSSAPSRYKASWVRSGCIIILPGAVGRTERGAAAADPHSHRALGHIQQPSDFGVGEARDQVQQQRGALVARNTPKRLLDTRSLDRAAVGSWASRVMRGQQRQPTYQATPAQRRASLVMGDPVEPASQQAGVI